MTCAELIDYLQQFDGDILVVISEDDIEEPCEFIALDTLLFNNGSLLR